MILILLVFFAFWLGESGELGARVEGPSPAGALWLEQAWEWPGWSVSGRAEFDLFPVGFRRVNLKLGADFAPVFVSCEFAALGTGRLDFFVSGLGKFKENLGEMNGFVHTGFKAGWVGVNISPTWISTAWMIMGIEREPFSLELDLSGPEPWAASLEIKGANLNLTFSSAVSLELFKESEPWRVRSTIQVWPFARQTHALVWSVGPQELRLWFSTAGQIGLRLGASQKAQTISALFLFSGFRLTQVSLEVTRTF